MKKKILSIVLVAIYSLLLVLPVSGAGLLASPAKFNVNLNSSQTFSGSVNVQNTGNGTLQVTIDKKRELNNGKLTLLADDGIAQWISLDTTNITLKPGETKTISFTVKAPTTINYKDAFGVIVIKAIPLNNQNNSNNKISVVVKQGVELLIPIIVGLPGPITESISMLGHDVPWLLLTYIPGDFNYHIKNNGTVMENVTVNSQINGWFNSYDVKTSGKVYPKNDYYLKNTWKPDIYDFGVYTVETNLTYGQYNGTKTLTQKDNVVVLPIWLIILILLALTVWILRKKGVKSPVVIKRRKED
jgi:Predicted membrane protein